MIEYSLIKGEFTLRNEEKEYVVKQIETLKKDLFGNRIGQIFMVFLTGVCALVTKTSYEMLNTIALPNDFSLETLKGYLAGTISVLGTLGFGYLTIDGVLYVLESTFERALLQNEKKKLERELNQITEEKQDPNLTR